MHNVQWYTILLIASLPGVGTASRLTQACTALCVSVGDQILVGRNYDWHLDQATVVVNPAGLDKTALAVENAAQWTSRYGSVTINQYGRELPCEGMNQAGLVIAVLWLDATQYPAMDDRPTVSSAQWVQYQLDTATSIEDVVASDEVVRISAIGDIRVHYFIADASGQCAVIDFLDGRQVVHCGTALPSRAITNNDCASSLQHLTQFDGFGGRQQPDGKTGSLSRLVRAATGVKRLSTQSQVTATHVFDLLEEVRQGDRTQWQVVYDISATTLRLQTANNQGTRIVDLGKLPLDEPTDVRMARLNDLPVGDATSSIPPYDPALNRAQIEYAFARTHATRQLPEFVKNMVLYYSEALIHPAQPASQQ